LQIFMTLLWPQRFLCLFELGCDRQVSL
jgi:hypothetical protein